MRSVVYKLPGHFLDRQHKIDKARVYGALRHAGIFGLCFFLDHGHAARPFDLLKPQRPIGTGAGKYDANRPLALVFRERPEEEIDRQVHAMGFFRRHVV